MSGVLEFEFKIELIVESKACLWMRKNGQNNKKCDVDSTPVPHEQISVGVSLKLCFFLWHFNGLKPTRNWNRYLRSRGS